MRGNRPLGLVVHQQPWDAALASTPYTAAPALSPASSDADEKFIGAVLGTLAQVLPHVAPVVLDAITTRRKELETSGVTPSPEDQEKFLGSVLSTVAQVVPHVAPMILEAIRTRRKDLEAAGLTAPMAAAGTEEKCLGAILGAVGSVIPHVAPIVIDAVLACRKELEVETGVAFRGDGVDEKLLPFIVGAVASAIPHVAPLIVDAVRGRRKELEEGVAFGAVGGAQVEEKLFAEILRHTRQVFTCFAGLPAAAWVPGAPARAITPAKAMEPGLAEAAATGPEVDEKFLGAVVSALARVLPAVTPVILDAVRAQRKAVAGTGSSADDRIVEETMNRLREQMPQWFGTTARPAW